MKNNHHIIVKIVTKINDENYNYFEINIYIYKSKSLGVFFIIINYFYYYNSLNCNILFTELNYKFIVYDDKY